MKIQESAENYLETILILHNRKGYVRSTDIATELGFSKPSVSVAMKDFRTNEYIVMDENGFMSLTEKAMSIASAVYEKHTVLSRWLVSLGVDPKTAAEDACRMEHVISQESFTKLKEHAEKCHFEE